MAIKTINNITCHYEISTGITPAELKSLAGNPKTSIIQYASPLTTKEIEYLEEFVFSKRPDIMLRIYAHYGKECDLSVIKKIPSLTKFSADCLMNASGIETVTELNRVDKLAIGIYNLSDFSFLDSVDPTLTDLRLFQTKTKKPKIDVIERFKSLNFLYLEGQAKGIEAINHLHKLEKIVLRSISTNDVAYLSNLPELWSVDVKLGGIKDFSALKTLKKLRYLELWQVRQLSNISFISELVELQHLFMQSLPNVTSLPNLDKLSKLRKLNLENMKGLVDMQALRTAPALEDFHYALAQNQQPEDLLPALENKIVKRTSCYFGSDVRNNKFKELARSYGKSEC